MRTPLTPGNPYGHSRMGYAWEQVPRDVAAHLDYGCYTGGFLASLADRGVRRLVGIDASRDAVAQARAAHPNLELVHHGDGPIPLPDQAFDSASLLDVLEHVADQAALLADLRRVLKPGGLLIVTVPGQHVFSWLDLGNLKFRFPRIHRWHYCRTHSRAEYEARYVSNVDGMIGDISADKRWHEHFSRDKLGTLLARAGFSVVQFDGSQLFGRWLILAGAVLGRVPGARRMIHAVERWDSRRFQSMNLFCLARRD